MSWSTRLTNVFRQRRLDREIEEELAAHIEEAIEQGRPAGEARKALGSVLHHRERSRDIRLLPWLDALAADFVFGWRQLRKRPVVSGAAILSLALAIGSATAAFRLIHAVMLRTLPVADPQNLFLAAMTTVGRDGQTGQRDDFDYPTFRRYREAVADRADLMVVGNVKTREMAMFGAGNEPEHISRQYVSGNFFAVLGLRPALGLLFTPDDDRVAGGHPVAVLSYDYWQRRFGGKRDVPGATFRMAAGIFTIIGVAPKGFIGTEPGAITDIYLPAMMNREALDQPGWSWFRLWVRPKAGFTPEEVRQPMEALFAREHQEGLKRFDSDTPQPVIDAYLKEKVILIPAASGASDVRQEYRRPLLILAALVGLVLLIACTNVGNLMTAQATARAREMALRVSIGAGQWRLIQLVLVESLLVSALATVLGTVFATWSAPLVVAMLHVPEDPVRLVLDSGWRDAAFAALAATSVALLFGLAPALRASNVKPAGALRGGDDPRSRRRLIHSLLVAEVAFCVLVQFVAGLFVSTFQRLSNRPLGFSAERLLFMGVDSPQDRPPEFWTQVADELRGTPGIESAALATWPLLERSRWTVSVRLPGRAVEPDFPYALGVAPGYFATMRIGLIAGREFRPGDLPARLDGSNQPLAGVGIVNEAFARKYFEGRNPVGKSIYTMEGKDTPAPVEIIGYVRDAVYYDIRERMHPTIFVPARAKNGGTFMVRTTGDALAVAPLLRRAMQTGHFGLSVREIQPETNMVRWQMLRERLLGTLSFFFAIVALVLAAVGLYGVLNYSVTCQRREIGIRMTLGAQPAQIARRSVSGLMGMVSAGLLVGLAAGIACGRLAQSLLYEVRATDPASVAVPLLTLLAAAAAAALPPAVRAVRIDPAETLRSE